MPEGQGYQSGLIAALRGSSPNDAPTTPGIQFLPNAPMAPFNPMNFGAPQMSGNLMTPPSMPRAPSYSPPGQQAFMPPPMTGNLMPAPVMPSALDYVRPLPQVVPFPLPEPGDEWDFRGTGST
jgi:hypothetical protein